MSHRRPKTILLLSLLGAATPFQASSTHRLPLTPNPTQNGGPHQPNGGDSQDATQLSQPQLHATANHLRGIGGSLSRPLRLSYSSPKSALSSAAAAKLRSKSSTPPSHVLVRKDNGLVLQSSAAGRTPLNTHVNYELICRLRAGYVASTQGLSASSTTSSSRQLVKFTAAAALGVAVVELLGRLLNLTSSGGTILAPALLSPLVDRSSALFALLLGPLFTVSFWSATAPLASICLKLSPMPTIQKIRRHGTTGGLPLLPYSAMCTMTFVLACYGILIQDTKVMITHGCGHLISLYYCWTFYRNVDMSATNLPGTVRMHARTGLSIAGALLLTIAALGKGAAPIAGMTSVLLSCIMYTGPLTVLKDAIRTQSAQNIPLPYAVASSFNALAWLVYGYFGIHNFMIYAPCLIGFLSASAQIMVHAVYGSGRRRAGGKTTAAAVVTK